ncbi:hypothetical protein PU629_09510 [Pullulanibacillus sp. KACC 23026]|uniref:hypothetical protein n=1 Tax=Pullulanibacillus sp. KACC 23026 TaxID=3028315 RepID=UPI0023AF9B71|nr:hypothetical protein [Pullulanibacillus sp. KACC 23026]WEG14571.1 hypothetical protein PU629_09510 [Pullulanibacillus sp. KACC 23026]
MKWFLVSLSMVAGMLLVNGIISSVFYLRFIDVSFFVGLVFSLFSGVLTYPKGENTDVNYYDLQVRNQTGLNVDRNRPAFRLSLPFVLSLAYTVISFIAVFLYHR